MQHYKFQEKIKRTFSLTRVLGQGARKCIYEIKLSKLVLPDIFYFGCSGFRFQFCSSSFYCAAARSLGGSWFQVHWFVLVLGSLATFRLSHLITKERGPLAIFERFRNALPGGRGSAREWVNCIWCFSLTASALVCLVLWSVGLRLDWTSWILHWLSFSSVSLLVTKACK